MNWTLVAGMVVLAIGACAVFANVLLTVFVIITMLFPTEEPGSVWEAERYSDGWYRRTIEVAVRLSYFPLASIPIAFTVLWSRDEFTLPNPPIWLGNWFWICVSILAVSAGAVALEVTVCGLKMTRRHRAFIVVMHVAMIFAMIGVFALLLTPVAPVAVTATVYSICVLPCVTLFVIRYAFITSEY